MNSRLKNILLLLMAVALLFGISGIQQSMNRDRELLGLTRVQPLENAPPVLAFTTVALGGFRGLISNLLWMRATDLQDEDKFFEMVQLADWITKLEPHYTQVWSFEAWNMGWNISVKFKDFADRWRWLRRAIELLRDDALRYNPDDILLYRELAWIFQDKMGKGTDDASLYYKRQWMLEMEQVFTNPVPDFDNLIHPRSPDDQRRAQILKEKFKLDPAFMKEVDQHHGPLEWRLPEAHAIYWAAYGMKVAADNPTRVNPGDLITLRRVIYQSMLLSFQRGRLEASPVAFEFGPNLDIIPKVNEAYERNLEEKDMYQSDIQRAQWNFLRQAVYSLYINNRMADAEKWFQYLAKKYPDRSILDHDPKSFPRNISLDRYAIGRVQEDVQDTSHDRVKNVVEGLIRNSYSSLIVNEDERALAFKNLAKKVYVNYESQIVKGREQAMSLGPFSEIDKTVLDGLLDPEHGAPPEVRALLRTKLRLPAEKAEPTPAQTSAAK